MKPPAAKPCPICERPAAVGLRPFCSPRCRDVDLQRWFSGVYVVPGPPVRTDRDPEQDDED